MSAAIDEAPKKRCPNIAWAFWHARKIALPKHERWVFIALAERADRDLHCKPTLAVLAADTGLGERSVWTAINGLKAAPDAPSEGGLINAGLIDAERRADGMHYVIKRVDVHEPRFAWDVENKNVAPPISHALRDAEDIPSRTPCETPPVEPPPSRTPCDLPSRTPCDFYNESPLEESPLEEGSLRSPHAHAGAREGDSAIIPIDETAIEHAVIPIKRRALSERQKQIREVEPEGFDEWFANYPRQDDRRHAALAYRAARKRGASIADLLSGLQRYRFDDDPKYHALPTTWLNGDRWKTRQPRQDTFDPALRGVGLTPEMMAEYAQQSRKSPDQPSMPLVVVGGRR